MKITRSELKEIIREELLKEATNARAKKNLMKDLKTKKVADVWEYDNDHIVVKMANGEHYLVGNIQKYEED